MENQDLKISLFFVPPLHGLVLSMPHAAPTPELGDYKTCFWLTEDEVSATKEVIFYSFKNTRM